MSGSTLFGIEGLAWTINSTRKEVCSLNSSTMTADKLALLARGLDDAAVALHGDLTDDAARQHVWGL